jgi:hypothetical protein
LRKLTAVVLLSLLTFNWFGYRFVVQYLENRSNVLLQSKLDKEQFDSKDLFEVRFTLNLPYITDWKEFENYSGETTINGHHYRYVKRKLAGNQLVLLCVPNRESDRLQKAGTEYFKQVNDIPGAEKKSKLPIKIAKAISKDFNFRETDPITTFETKPIIHCSFLQLNYIPFYPATPVQPPNA